jgi:hypothetical protein
MSAISKMEKMMKGKKGNDSKYFSTTKKGEIRELQDELANQDREKKKDAVKKSHCSYDSWKRRFDVVHSCCQLHSNC